MPASIKVKGVEEKTREKGLLVLEMVYVGELALMAGEEVTIQEKVAADRVDDSA